MNCSKEGEMVHKLVGAVLGADEKRAQGEEV